MPKVLRNRSPLSEDPEDPSLLPKVLADTSSVPEVAAGLFLLSEVKKDPHTHRLRTLQTPPHCLRSPPSPPHCLRSPAVAG